MLFLDENGDVYALDIADIFQGNMIEKYTQDGTWPHMEDDPDYAYSNHPIRWVSKDSPEYAEPLPDAESLTFIYAIQAVVCAPRYEELTIDKTITHEEMIPTKNLK